MSRTQSKKYLMIKYILSLMLFLFVGKILVTDFYSYMDTNFIGPVSYSQLMNYPVSAECQDTHNGSFSFSTDNTIRVISGTNQSMYETFAAEYNASLKKPLNLVRKSTLPWPHGAPSFKESLRLTCPEKFTDSDNQ